MADGGQERALRDNGNAVEAALTRATQRAADLAQAIAEAAPPSLPFAEVQATIAAWAQLPPSDPQRAHRPGVGRGGRVGLPHHHPGGRGRTSPGSG